MIPALLLAVALGASAAAAFAATPGPGFDCTRATGEAQALICADAQLATLDRETARLYALASRSEHLDTKRRRQAQGLPDRLDKGSQRLLESR